jgi:uncharacterized protein involved in propanediol utilization
MGRTDQRTIHPSYNYPEITVPPGMWKAVPRGRGMGSSTADVTATIRAVANFHGVTPSAEEIAKIAVQAELLLAESAFEFLPDTCRRCNGCGVQVAHSGTVAGIIFDPSQAGGLRLKAAQAEPRIILFGTVSPCLLFPLPLPRVER